MKKADESKYCSLGKGEIYPYSVSGMPAYSKDQSENIVKMQKTRSCYKEMMANYNHSR